MGPSASGTDSRSRRLDQGGALSVWRGPALSAVEWGLARESSGADSARDFGRPSGTCVALPAAPALKRWAKFVRSCGARVEAFRAAEPSEESSVPTGMSPSQLSADSFSTFFRIL